MLVIHRNNLIDCFHPKLPIKQHRFHAQKHALTGGVVFHPPVFGVVTTRPEPTLNNKTIKLAKHTQNSIHHSFVLLSSHPNICCGLRAPPYSTNFFLSSFDSIAPGELTSLLYGCFNLLRAAGYHLSWCGPIDQPA